MISSMRWVLVACLTACGPVAYVNQVTRTAAVSVDEARAAKAEKLSPYWWTRATLYLHMAREVAGHADFQGANHFGRLAEEAAQKAIAEAKAGGAQPPPADLNTTTAPAKEAGTAPAKDAE